MKKTFFAAIIVLILLLLPITMLSGCGSKSNAQGNGETGLNDVEELSDEQALAAIRNYCYSRNPDLEGIVKAGEYPVYWDISSSDEKEIVVLFRSYTGAQNRYYIDRLSGETYVTEFVPGITDEEQLTDESFNIRDYFGN